MQKNNERKLVKQQEKDSGRIILNRLLLVNIEKGRPFMSFSLEILSILSDRNRKKILFLLRDDSKCVKEIQMGLDISQSTLSNHLKVLLDYGIIKVKTTGRRRYYRISEPDIFQVYESLDDDLLSSLKKNIRYNKLKQAIRNYDIESLIQSK